MSRCLHLCCSTPLCNVAVFGEVNSCYLFDCGSPDSFKCQFTGSDDFSSAVLEIDRHRFDLSAADRQRDHSDQLSQLRDPKPDNQDQVSKLPKKILSIYVFFYIIKEDIHIYMLPIAGQTA